MVIILLSIWSIVWANTAKRSPRTDTLAGRGAAATASVELDSLDDNLVEILPLEAGGEVGLRIMVVLAK